MRVAPAMGFSSYLIIVATLLAPSRSAAQTKRPKVDSLLATVALPKAEASDAVVAAFTGAGLDVTGQTSSIVTADLGEQTVEFGGGYSRHRVVRATLLPGVDSTRVLIVGNEELIRRGRTEKRFRIDNKARGNGGKVWAKMLAAARALDSSSVTPESETVPEPKPDHRSPGRP